MSARAPVQPPEPPTCPRASLPFPKERGVMRRGGDRQGPPPRPAGAAPAPAGRHEAQGWEVVGNAAVLRARSGCKQKRFPEGTEENPRVLLKWVIVLQQVRASWDLLTPRQDKGGLMTAPLGPGVCFSHSLTSTATCCSGTATSSVCKEGDRGPERWSGGPQGHTAGDGRKDWDNGRLLPSGRPDAPGGQRSPRSRRAAP